jgi:HSP20 family molecular chaperone IbpA
MSAQSGTAMQPAKASVPIRQGTADLVEQFNRIYDSIARRAFELFEGNGYLLGHDLDDWLRAEGELLHPVHLEMAESDRDLYVRAEVPGFSAKELEIKVEPRSLRIAGRREIKEEKNGERRLRSECLSDQILRAIDLPVEVDTARVNATLKDGILTIDLPKAANAKAVRVQPRTV